MLFQLDVVILGAIITVIILALIMFFIGIKVMQWYAKKKEWDPSFKTALIVNLVWLIIDLPLGFIFTLLFEGGIVFDLLRLLIGIFIGTFLVMQLYKKKFGESLLFVIVVELILFVIAIILGIIIGVILAIVLIAVFL